MRAFAPKEKKLTLFGYEQKRQDKTAVGNTAELSHHVTQQFRCKQPLGHLLLLLLLLSVLLDQYFVRENTILLGCYAMSTGVQ
jgi:hypothetical protein